jgi:hypothetical protein
MVIVVCKDDPELLVIALRSAAANGLGSVFQLDADQIPKLQSGENLFVIAHGDVTDPTQPGNAMIGDERAGGYGYNGVDLFARLSGIFPQGYRGNVYFSACYTADWLTTDTDAGFSFIETFKTQIAVASFGFLGRIYGNRGEVRGNIPPPADRRWYQPAI